MLRLACAVLFGFLLGFYVPYQFEDGPPRCTPYYDDWTPSPRLRSWIASHVVPPPERTYTYIMMSRIPANVSRLARAQCLINPVVSYSISIGAVLRFFAAAGLGAGFALAAATAGGFFGFFFFDCGQLPTQCPTSLQPRHALR